MFPRAFSFYVLSRTADLLKPNIIYYYIICMYIRAVGTGDFYATQPVMM